MRVWLIGTFHETRGLTNAANLETILERIGPDVVFLECPPSVFHEVLNGTRRNLEFDAVRSYAAKTDVRAVPVDLPTPPASFFEGGADLFEAVERVSSDYRRLIDLNGAEVAGRGFPYLNSEDCSALWAEVYSAMGAAVARLADPRLTELHDLWTATHHRRDQAMLRGIDDYSKHTPFETGVLLVGAAHRRTILDESRENWGDASPRIERDLSKFFDASA